jgi:hypothetical protein
MMTLLQLMIFNVEGIRPNESMNDYLHLISNPQVVLLACMSLIYRDFYQSVGVFIPEAIT